MELILVNWTVSEVAVTIQDVINKLIDPVKPLPMTVDTLISGNPNTPVMGIVTTFMATYNVISQTVALGANLITSHEGVFYSHHGKTEALADNGVYLAKQRLIDTSGVGIFRLHDYIHLYQPDAVMVGLLQSLGWESYVNCHHPTSTILTIPTMPLGEVAEFLKRKLQLPFLRVAGDLSMRCSRVGLLVGYRGGAEMAIPLFQDENVDVIIAGEGPEWEAPEYVRDALAQGENKGLILLGHAQSEEPGMRYLAELLQSMFPQLPVHFVAEAPCFQVI